MRVPHTRAHTYANRDPHVHNTDLHIHEKRSIITHSCLSDVILSIIGLADALCMETEGERNGWK